MVFDSPPLSLHGLNCIVSALISRKRCVSPVVISVILDVLSRSLRRTPGPTSSLERSEYARRDRDLLWYFLRGDIWQLPRARLNKFAVSFGRFPVVGILGVFLKEWIPLIDDYYYCACKSLLADERK